MPEAVDAIADILKTVYHAWMTVFRSFESIFVSGHHRAMKDSHIGEAPGVRYHDENGITVLSWSQALLSNYQEPMRIRKGIEKN